MLSPNGKPVLIGGDTFEDVEIGVHAEPDSWLQRKALQLLAKVVELNSEVHDPLYFYAGSRIRREALLCRDADRDKLRKELEQCRKELEQLKLVQSTPAQGVPSR